jgi:acyl dehydratase
MTPTALKQRWFEDYAVGEVFEFGQHEVTEQEIIGFARQYDPQPFHVDPEAAKSSPYQGLIASGWMTAALAMRMVCDHFIAAQSSMGSPGVDQVRWLHPVRPGDRLRMRVSILAVQRSRSKPDRGVVTARQEVINQHQQTVMSLDGKSMHRVRP